MNADYEEYDEFNVEVAGLCNQFLNTNIIELCYPDFNDRIVDYVTKEMFDDCLCAGMLDADLDRIAVDEDYSSDVYSEFRDRVEDVVKAHLKMAQFRKRSYRNPKPHHNTCLPVDVMDTRIQTVQSAFQPAQRTAEWYIFRHNLITASNIWKALGSEANVNSLICEKCKPLAIRERAASVDDGLEEEPITQEPQHVNTQSTLHWGVKYEPVTAMIYSYRNQVTVGEFGCIQHPQYSFIGASPDGIVLTRESPLYGRMLEIKNIVNRVVDGIPSMPYWVQMQVQMEVCDLEECDFVETVFKEYDDTDEEQFYANVEKYLYNGVILYFIKRDHSDSSPKYVYMPMSVPLDRASVNAWIEEQKQENRQTYVLYRRIYWYCDRFSCVLVHRSREWFAAALPKIRDVWTLIEQDRVDGCEHRRPKPKVAKAPVVGGCLMNLDGLE